MNLPLLYEIVSNFTGSGRSKSMQNCQMGFSLASNQVNVLNVSGKLHVYHLVFIQESIVMGAPGCFDLVGDAFSYGGYKGDNDTQVYYHISVFLFLFLISLLNHMPVCIYLAILIPFTRPSNYLDSRSSPHPSILKIKFYFAQQCDRIILMI